MNAISKRDIAILRELARQTTEIANLPIQAEKRSLWKALNGLRPVRPMVDVYKRQSDAHALKGRARGSGTAEQSSLVQQDNFAIGANIDQHGRAVPVDHVAGQ